MHHDPDRNRERLQSRAPSRTRDLNASSARLIGSMLGWGRHPKTESVLQLKVRLLGISLMIWRRLLVPKLRKPHPPKSGMDLPPCADVPSAPTA